MIFDYSGTLSVEAPFYGSQENLAVQLERTGLKDFGVITPQFYWEEIVNPTWKEGSTTTAGYKQLMKDKIKERMSKESTHIKESAIAEAVCLFVDDYLEHSRIDSRWRPILTTLYKTAHVRTMIATDHYAEATDAIIIYLRQWDIHAFRPMDATVVSPGEEAFIVANSADMGVHKSDRFFWTSIKTTLQHGEFNRILLIDDFGYNEQAADDYALQDAVGKRKSATIHLLQDIFPAKVTAIPFFLDLSASAADQKAHCGRLITETSTFINNFLEN